MISRVLASGLAFAVFACDPPQDFPADVPPEEPEPGAPVDTGTPADGDPREGLDTGDPGDTEAMGDPFADRVVSFSPGTNAGFGARGMPDIVLGPPMGTAAGGSLDVVSLGKGGEIVLAMDDFAIIDGPGPDLIVFENPFPGWIETGEVSVSANGEDWYTWPCTPSREAEGCAGVTPTLAGPGLDADPTNPAESGGDLFDLADLGLAEARFVRVRDTATNSYDGISGGFDLDAVAAVPHGRPVE